MNKNHNLLIKFKPEVISCVKDGRLCFVNDDEISREANFVHHLSYRLAIPDLAISGKTKCTENEIDFSQYKGLVYVESDMTCNELEDHAEKLRQLDIVEYVVLEPVEPIIPPHITDQDTPDISVMYNTPNFTGYQGYFRAQDGVNVNGIDADYAHSIGVTGRGIRCADIEWGNIYGHENLRSDNFIELVAAPSSSKYDSHGAAVTGVIFAKNNGFGVKGAAYDLDYFYGISELTYGRVSGISTGLRYL